ncbi:MAG: hypothetical protein ABL930_07850 [Pseudobdellovibrio sp.]
MPLKSKSIHIFLWILLLAFAGCIFSLGLKHTLDARIFYTQDDALAFLQSLDSTGLQTYLHVELLDLGFIFTYSMLMYVTLRKMIPNRFYFCFIAFIPGFFDLVETANIILFLQNPTYIQSFAWLGTITFLKWTTSAVLLCYISFLRLRLKQSFGNRS